MTSNQNEAEKAELTLNSINSTTMAFQLLRRLMCSAGLLLPAVHIRKGGAIIVVWRPQFDRICGIAAIQHCHEIPLGQRCIHLRGRDARSSTSSSADVGGIIA